jgi:hypothetical protein
MVAQDVTQAVPVSGAYQQGASGGHGLSSFNLLHSSHGRQAR